MRYRARLTHDADGWCVFFDDCRGCQTQGDSEAEALANAKEAVEGWLESQLVTNRLPPRPAAKRGTPIELDPELALALQVRWAREDKGLSRAALAKLAGVSLQQVAWLARPLRLWPRSVLRWTWTYESSSCQQANSYDEAA